MAVVTKIGDPTHITFRHRTVAYATWTLGTDDSGDEIQACLSCFHHGAPRKQYTASLNRQAFEHRPNGVGVTKFGLFSGVRVLVEPTPRFNQKTFEAFVHTAVAKVTELLEADDPSVTKIFGGETS